MRRVVVTGMGIVSSIGNSTQEVLASLREARSGISKAADYERLGFRCQVHGAPTLDPEEAVDRRAMRFHGGGTGWNDPNWTGRFWSNGTWNAGNWVGRFWSSDDWSTSYWG